MHINLNSNYDVVDNLCRDIELPKMVRVSQKFDTDHIEVEDIPGIVKKELSKSELSSNIKEGMTIAISCGSRGVANIPLITKSIVEFVKSKGAEPFVFPAMGSHGGATAEGQKKLLEGYGVTEEYIGCPIKSSMETVQIGKTIDDMPVYTDKNAYQADGIIICGRIKAHTAFRGDHESGLMKMSVIGMGKQHMAETIHEKGFENMADIMPKVAKVVLDNMNIVACLGLIENAYDQTYKIIGLTKEEIWTKEPELLKEAKAKMGSILFDDIDVLIVDEVGKDISGDGMDPNVTGRFACKNADDGKKRVQRIVVLDLTEKTHGNFNGVGIADIITQRLYKKMNAEETYPNGVTSTVLDVVKIPFIAKRDETAIKLAIKTCNNINRSKPSIVRIKNTMEIDEIYISEALVKEAEVNPNIEILSNAEEWDFDNIGNLF